MDDEAARAFTELQLALFGEGWVVRLPMVALAFIGDVTAPGLQGLGELTGALPEQDEESLRRMIELADQLDVPVPASWEGVALMYSQLGLIEGVARLDQSQPGSWQPARFRPTPTEALGLTGVDADNADRYRQLTSFGPHASLIETVLADMFPDDDTVTVTITQLARMCRQDPETVRQALAFVNTWRADPDVDLDALEETARFALHRFPVE